MKGSIAIANQTWKQSSRRLLQVYLWALSFAKPYWRLLAAIVLLGIAETTIALLIPKFIQYFIDAILPASDISGFSRTIVLLAVLIVILIAAKAVQNLLQRSFQEKASRDVQYGIFRHLRKLGFAYFEQHPVGESLAMMNTEITAMQRFYRILLPWMIQGLLFTVVSIIFMASMSIGLTLIMIPSFLIYYSFGPYFANRNAALGKKLASDRMKTSQYAYESLSGLQDLRGLSGEKWALNRLFKQQDVTHKTMVFAFLFGYCRASAQIVSYYAGGIAVILYGAYCVQQEIITPGAFVAFLLYFFQAMQRLTSIVINIAEQKVLMGQVEKLYQFMNLKPEIEEQERSTNIQQVQGQLEFRDVGFAYPNGSHILEHFHLHMSPGERVALVGPSGGGKSTVLKLVGRFYHPVSGQILLDGVPIELLSFSQLRGAIGYVFQETYLFGSSVRENIWFGRPEASESEVIAAAKLANAHDFIMALTQGYDTMLGERGVKLSGGQKQRISIARMFLKDPAVILLDEATSSLDYANEQEIQASLKLLKGRSTLTIAHRISTVKDYDKLLYLEHGRVVEQGSYEELLELKGSFYRMVLDEKEREREEA